MKLYVKLGTHAGQMMIAPKIRKPPKVGQLFGVRELGTFSWTRLQQVHLLEIRDLGGQLLYFVELM